MALRVRKANNFTAGDSKVTDSEKYINEIKFKIHKFTPRKRPTDTRNVVIFPMFSEFGCETLASVYCLPLMMQKYFVGKYSIVMGWAGRSYFYKHLVDEFWELPEEHMWLREYCRAFHHVSRNLKRAEKQASDFGTVLDISYVGNVMVFPILQKCINEKCGGDIILIDGNYQMCSKCKNKFAEPGLFNDIAKAKKLAVWLPPPSAEKMTIAKKYLPPNAVGITARHRKTWGRNLDPIFYERLIYLLEDMGYNPVWIGEKVTSLPCPFKRIVDFSSTEDANDLETTLALVSQLKFTVQLWTASSRLAAMMGVPYIIVESPDQIWGKGQEGMRLNLITRGNRKLIVSHYKNVYEDNTATLKIIERAIIQMQQGNYEDVIGLVENKDCIRHLRATNGEKVGDK
jgi:hypothetical protein